MGVFTDFANYLDFINNVVSIIILLASITMVIYIMFNKFVFALRSILRPMGLSFGNSLKALFICRKNSNVKRAFLEYSILKTRGNTVLSSEWKNIINDFKSWYVEGQPAVYKVKNCTALIDESFAVAVNRYFRYMSSAKARSTFFNSNDSFCWLTTISIEEAYVTPSFLLTGLLSRYEENWNLFINKYMSSTYTSPSDDKADDDVLPEEVYETFAWILWGPSYEIPLYRSGLGLCQISYGDESNSLPALLRSEQNAELVSSIENNGKNGTFGALYTTDCKLFPSNNYFSNMTNLDGDLRFYCNKVENDADFVLELTGSRPVEGRSNTSYYNTAYVWVLFELIGDGVESFQPQHSIAFFEHANIANAETYSFLVDSVIEKSARHFQKIFQTPKYANRKYRFVCALNRSIEEQCRNKYAALSAGNDELSAQFESRIVFDGKYHVTDVFSAFDTFFEDSSAVSFQEIDATKKDDLQALAMYYAGTYLECFPDADERESLDNLLFYLNQKKDIARSGNNYHIILAKNAHDNILGGIIFDYFAQSNSGFIEYVAVSPDYQSNGLGSALVREATKYIASDAAKQNKKPDYIFCEVDISGSRMDRETRKRLNFWAKQDFLRLEFSYLQPALAPDKSEVNNLWLIAKRLSEKQTPNTETTLTLVADLMKYAMQIDEPEKNAQYKKMKAELDGSDLSSASLL